MCLIIFKLPPSTTFERTRKLFAGSSGKTTLKKYLYVQSKIINPNFYVKFQIKKFLQTFLRLNDRGAPANRASLPRWSALFDHMHIYISCWRKFTSETCDNQVTLCGEVILKINVFFQFHLNYFSSLINLKRLFTGKSVQANDR